MLKLCQSFFPSRPVRISVSGTGGRSTDSYLSFCRMYRFNLPLDAPAYLNFPEKSRLSPTILAAST
ncbi:MAG: hypothetical protein LBL04_02775 [Bacteroidales bacterium]|nr:hypothetical protein [Bacteroidales bacterium]